MGAPNLNSCGRQMREGLRHTRPGQPDAEFFSAIDATGGWPVGLQYVGFEHTDSRNAGFTNSPYNDGWWTVVASADDYYLWKLSPAALQRIADAVVRSIQLSAPDMAVRPPTIWSSRGGIAALAKTKVSS